jgi:LL-diaminopimelate aminotransferase
VVERNSCFEALEGGYLFHEIQKRKDAFIAKNPAIKLISLGIGDTTLPLASHVAQALSDYGKGLGTESGYQGYGPSKGDPLLRKKIAEVFYNGLIDPDDLFITDGAKCDIARLQLLFSQNCTVAIQDPCYPVYKDTTIMTGKKLHFLLCTPENNFFPKAEKIPKVDIVMICSPNNPTGATATKQQLQEIVDWAKKNKSVLIFDAAYSGFIKDKTVIKSIFEIPGADEVAIEMNSFSKIAGFTGVRLSWTAVTDKLKYNDGGSLKNDWSRLLNTCFNGASRISQHGALAVLDKAGWGEIEKSLDSYMDNTKKIQRCLNQLGIKTYGGENIPYVWASFPGKSSWDVFDQLLNQCHIVTTPGVGFGETGESFIRFSAFGHPQDVDDACMRLVQRFKI